ncbi:TetR/AcrR family transcriptional regulator [Pseudohoeflea coraliihabitans]|uniref:TetR/AcrR family transcriptional regulator n=1 Tax=Pseudohoeflea coraliihabitans TaxID=2860393 RepID=A0ABS6WJ55_9HYPH|nr:TetR/AcrR family transcriptional regulator [Pseudohoeflea sp. DP4N28-3]MBW3095972.1 TetR/AcrR family transcriptional regulator [Pseudohoeflea sp. DP4N28-3]
MPRTRKSTKAASVWNEVAELKREKILQSAVDLFYQNGYLPTTMDVIAESIGATKPFVYYHYENKAELLSEIARRTLREWLAVTTHVTDQSLPPKEALSLAAQQFTMIVLNMYKLVSIYYREQLNLPKEVADEIAGMRREIDAQVRTILAEGKKTGVFEFEDLAVASQVVTGMVSFVFAWYREPSRLSKEEICAQMVSHVLRSVGATTTPS